MTIASSGLFIIQVFTFGVANHGTRWNASTLFMAALYLIVSFVGDIKVFPCIRKHTQCEHVRVVREVDLLIRLRGAHRNVMAILDGYVIRPRLPASSATFLRVFVRGKLLHSTRMQVECSSFPRTKNASFAVRNALLEAGKSNRAFSRQTQTHKRIHRLAPEATVEGRSLGRIGGVAVVAGVVVEFVGFQLKFFFRFFFNEVDSSFLCVARALVRSRWW